LLVPLALALLAYAVLIPDWMPEFRFATPIWCLAALISVLSVFRVIQQTALRGRVLLALGLAGALLPSVSAFRAGADAFRAAPLMPMCNVTEQWGRTFNSYADILGMDRRATLLLPDIGGTVLAKCR
jgi:hypothetical protein